MEEKRRSLKNAAIYIAVTFLITYLYEFLIIYPAMKSPVMSQLSLPLIAVAMFFPTAGMLITRLITREGFKGLFIKPNFRGNIRFYIAAWLLPPVLTILGMVFYFLIFPAQFDSGLSPIISIYALQGITVTPQQVLLIIIVQLLSALITSAVFNFIPCLGEEWGWRGYMSPRLNSVFGFFKGSIIGGVVWGLWHAPLTAIGHNYGTEYSGFPILGIAAMCVFCTALGTFFSYLSARSKSCLPAALGHAMINGFAGLSLLFTVGGKSPLPYLGPSPAGIIGGMGLIITAIVCIVLAKRNPPEDYLALPPKASDNVIGIISGSDSPKAADSTSYNGSTNTVSPKVAESPAEDSTTKADTVNSNLPDGSDSPVTQEGTKEPNSPDK